MAALTDVLSRNQIRVSEERFAALLEQALAEFGGRPADPRATLTGEESDALRGVGADLSPLRAREADPRLGGATAYAAVLASALTVKQAAGRLGIDPSRVRHRLLKHQLIGIQQPRGWLLPAYQFGEDGGPLPGLERVAAAVAGTHAVVVARFFTTPQPELVVGRRRLAPREWLAGGGDPGRVAELARALDVAA